MFEVTRLSARHAPKPSQVEIQGTLAQGEHVKSKESKGTSAPGEHVKSKESKGPTVQGKRMFKDKVK